MYLRNYIFYSAADQGGGAGAATGGQAGSAPAPKPGDAAPAGGAPKADEPPAWAKALIEKVSALEGSKAKLEADKAKVEQEKHGAEQAKVSLEEQVQKLRSEQSTFQIDAATARELAKYRFKNDKAGDHALKVFKADFDIQVKDGSVLAIGRGDGKAQHVSQAFADFLKGAGADFIAAAAQPGLGAPNGATPGGVDPSKMTREQLREQLRGEGFKGKLTADEKSPEVVIRRVGNPYLEAWQAKYRAANGTGK